MGRSVVWYIFFAVLGSSIFLGASGVYSSQAGTSGIEPPTGDSSQVGGMPDVVPQGAPTLTRKQKEAYLKNNYKKMKQDTAELVKLANALQKSVNSANSQMLSVNVVTTAEKIEKLAKKIKDNARGY